MQLVGFRASNLLGYNSDEYVCILMLGIYFFTAKYLCSWQMVNGMMLHVIIA